MEFKKIHLKEEIKINSIISLHYFEFAKDFVFEGERHDFWEFLYVDKGEADVMADTNGYNLKQGDIIFHKPNEFHSVWANKKIAPNLIVVSFDCRSKSIKFFENKIFTLGDNERALLANAVNEGFNSFEYPFDNPNNNILNRKSDPLLGSEQMLKIYLQLLLLKIFRKGGHLDKKERLSSFAKERSEEDILKRIIMFLEDNVSQNITLRQVCSFSNMGQTQLVTLFKKKTGMGVIEYYKNLKIEEAKKLIRQEKFNLTEISELLGYNNIQSFSRHFKNVTDMPASEYARTVKARLVM